MFISFEIRREKPLLWILFKGRCEMKDLDEVAWLVETIRGRAGAHHAFMYLVMEQGHGW